jgi:hypothetical protein
LRLFVNAPIMVVGHKPARIHQIPRIHFDRTKALIQMHDDRSRRYETSVIACDIVMNDPSWKSTVKDSF